MPSDFRGFFHFNKSERAGIIALLCLLFALLVYRYYLIVQPPLSSSSNADLLKAGKLLDSLNRADSLVFLKAKIQKRNHQRELDFKPFPFNPNTITKREWQQLGLSSKQAQTTLNYLAKGAVFLVKKDVSKVYSISEAQYAKMEPYILLPDSIPRKNWEKGIKKTWPSRTKIIVRINSADSSTFRSLKGIGPVLSGRIIKYREALGGFTSIAQLAEVYGLEDSLVAALGGYLKLDSVDLKKIKLNKFSAAEFKDHPYISWNLANALVAYRNQHGLFEQIEDIKKIKIIDDAQYQKLELYLSLDK